ncbi:hypothetical protein BJV74DRAFT_120614 [Russula compacta]|nr:hypothetical protein BJV74DRAFT_120614 [Russula compacta]
MHSTTIRPQTAGSNNCSISADKAHVHRILPHGQVCSGVPTASDPLGYPQQIADLLSKKIFPYSESSFQSDSILGKSPNNRTGAIPSATAVAVAQGTLLGKDIAQSDADDDSSSSSDEDPEIATMQEEMIRYVKRGPPGHPSHGSSVPRNPRPPPPPVAGGVSNPRPHAVTLGPGTTAKPKPPKK